MKLLQIEQRKQVVQEEVTTAAMVSCRNVTANEKVLRRRQTVKLKSTTSVIKYAELIRKIVL